MKSDDESQFELEGSDGCVQVRSFPAVPIEK